MIIITIHLKNLYELENFLWIAGGGPKPRSQRTGVANKLLNENVLKQLEVLLR